jgi:hypothetical protein
VPDLHDLDAPLLVVDRIDDPVVALTKAVAILPR